MSSEWNFYFCRVNDALASIFLDLGIRKEVPDRERPHLLWVKVEMNAPRKDGLSSSEEHDALIEVERALEKTVPERLGARYVGRITTSGRREFYFHAASDEGFEGAVNGALAVKPGYRFSLGSQADPGWTHYLSVLYPTDEERQRIENRKVLESLERHGDPLTKRRRIDHWIYFERESDVEAVVRALTPLGFEIAERAPDQDGGERPRIMLQVHREDLPDYRSIDDVTMPLFRLARDHGGEYDGWETSVEKEG